MIQQDWGWEEVVQAVFTTGLLIVGALLMIGEELEDMARRRRRRRAREDH